MESNENQKGNQKKAPQTKSTEKQKKGSQENPKENTITSRKKS